MFSVSYIYTFLGPSKVAIKSKITCLDLVGDLYSTFLAVKTLVVTLVHILRQQPRNPTAVVDLTALRSILKALF